jgi:arginine decarboxylase
MLPVLIAESFCLVAGTGTHQEDKNALDAARFAAGVHDLDLSPTTSIIPPGCKEISREEFRRRIQTPGQIVHAIGGYCMTNEEGQIASAALSVVQPDDPERESYVAEIFEKKGILPEVLTHRVQTMALQLFATRVGDTAFVVDDQWEQGRTAYAIGGMSVTLKSVVVSGVGQGKGKHTCAYVGAVLL